MRTQARDTSVVAETIVFDRYRAMGPTEKLAAMLDMISFVEQVSLSGIRDQYPEATAGDIQDRFAERWFRDGALDLYRKHRVPEAV